MKVITYLHPKGKWNTGVQPHIFYSLVSIN